MRQQHWFALIALVVLAFGAGYWLNHSTSTAVIAPATANSATEPDAASPPPHKQSTKSAASSGTIKTIARAAKATPLPPTGAPVAQIFDELKTRADGGDTEAAARLFHDLEVCRDVQTRARFVPRIFSSELDSLKKPETSAEMSDQDQMLAQMQHALDAIKRYESTCAGVEASQIEAIVPLMFEAAQAGDQRALHCYIGANFIGMPGLIDHPEWLQQYKENAMALAQSAYQRGDWMVVDLLQHAYSGLFSESLLAQMLGADPEQAYRYLKLKRLGANGDFADRLDKRLASAAQTLSAGQTAAADTWAQDAYTRYFNGSSSNELSKGPQVCPNLDDAQ
jgi:hypothetical protein